MNDRDLVQKLKAIKAEVLALKQSHEYGVGSTNFPYYEIDEPYGMPDKNIVVTVVFPSGSAKPFFKVYCIGIYDPEIVWNDNVLTYTRRYFDLYNGTFVFSIPPVSFSYEVVDI